jgi:UDP-glucose 4-epimerase
VRDFRTRLFESPIVMTLLGYDPLLQFLHPDDGVEALLRTIDTPGARGVFNITPDGVVPLSTALLLYGALPFPLFHSLGYAAQEIAWLSGIGVMPGVHFHYFRYLWIADNAKAKRVLGFSPARTSLENLLATAHARRGRGRALDWDALEDAARRATYRFDRAVRRGRPFEAPAPRPGAREKAAS